MPAWTSRPKDVLPANPAEPDIARLRTDEGVLLVLQDPRTVPGPNYPRAPKAPYLDSVRVLRDEEHGAVFIPVGRSSDSPSARAFRGARVMLTARQILAGDLGWVQHLDARDQEMIAAWAQAAVGGNRSQGEPEPPTAEPSPAAEGSPAPVTSGPSGHARLSPSAAARWMTCPGSVDLCDTVPEPPESPAAREGTAGHEVAEARLVRDLLKDYVRAEGMFRAWQEEYGGEYDLGHMIQDVEPYVREVKVAAEALGVDSAMGVWLERRVRLSDTVYGTADAVLVGTDVVGDPWGHILDLKLGRGVRVEADSKQLQIYAAALAREEARTGTPLSGVTVTIVQPRHRDGGHVSSRDYTAAELEAVALEVEAAAEAALAGDGPRVPSEDACRWCSAQAVCPERMRSLADSVGLEDLTAAPPSVADLEPAALPDLLRALPDLERWIKAVRAHASTMLDLDPGSVPGWAMVEGRGRRRVTQEAVDVAVSLGLADRDDLEVTSPVGVTELKRVLGSEGMRAIGDLLETAPGRPTLTYVGDGA